MDLPTRLEELRNARGLTQREVADAVGVSERTYQLWRKGETQPQRKTLKKIAEFYGEPLASLIEESAGTTGRLDRMEEKLDRLLAHLGA
jgi:transcriptional regulator with XRE-family HTH domain